MCLKTCVAMSITSLQKSVKKYFLNKYRGIANGHHPLWLHQAMDIIIPAMCARCTKFEGNANRN